MSCAVDDFAFFLREMWFVDCSYTVVGLFHMPLVSDQVMDKVKQTISTGGTGLHNELPHERMWELYGYSMVPEIHGSKQTESEGVA